MTDIDDAEAGPGGERELFDPPRRRPAPRLVHDDISRTAVSARFRGHVAWTLDEIGRLAQLFGCRVVDLVTEAPNKKGLQVW